MKTTSTEPLLVRELRDGFRFRSGSVPLDLTATLAQRLQSRPRELLDTPADLGRWLIKAGLTQQQFTPSESELVEARDVREAIYHLAMARVKNQPYAAADREVLNRWAVQPAPAPQLIEEGIRWNAPGAYSLLAQIAREAVELLGGPLAERIGKCGRDGCPLLFLDTSRSGRRRWCAMEGCGNKVKVKEFRSRRKK